MLRSDLYVRSYLERVAEHGYGKALYYRGVSGETMLAHDRIEVHLSENRYGDFNHTVSNWIGPERPTCKQDSSIQVRLADDFGLLNSWQQANPDQPL